MKRIALLFLIYIITTSLLWAQKTEVHPAIEEENCGACHAVMADGRASTDLRDDISAACISCHEGDQTNHPVDMEPPFSTPADLPLSEEGLMTCVTCHDPHMPRYDGRPWQASSLAGRIGSLFARRHHTYFLRRNNAHGELCLSCHRELEVR